MISGTFGTYILSIVGAVVLATVAEVLMPEGKTAKYVKNTLSIFLVLIIISPISKMIAGDIVIKDIFSSEVIQTDYSFISKLNEKKAQTLENNTERHLNLNGYSNTSIKILYTGNEKGIKIDYVHIDLTKFEFNGEGPHIHIIDNIKNLVSVYLGISKEYIYTYGAD